MDRSELNVFCFILDDTLTLGLYTVAQQTIKFYGMQTCINPRKLSATTSIANRWHFLVHKSARYYIPYSITYLTTACIIHR
jgi:hypothetical protein